mmetsp:Transcript_9423/g.20846  ORF Transcript_9423/g.20846 Transcript_9423/m.20846 type:complete len:224 (-) Transcript_9423:121-792(-)
MHNKQVSSVKLRLTWRAEAHDNNTKLCFNETLHAETTLAQWRSRISSKFGVADSTHCRLVLVMDKGNTYELRRDEDLERLRQDYATALNTQHASTCTLRLPVMVDFCADDAARAPSRACSASAGPGSLRSIRHDTATLRSGSAKRRRHPGSPLRRDEGSHHSAPHLGSRPRTRSASRLHDQTRKAVVAQPDLFWDRVLHSIVKTIDRHHFGSKLAASKPPGVS